MSVELEKDNEENQSKISSNTDDRIDGLHITFGEKYYYIPKGFGNLGGFKTGDSAHKFKFDHRIPTPDIGDIKSRFFGRRWFQKIESCDLGCAQNALSYFLNSHKYSSGFNFDEVSIVVPSDIESVICLKCLRDAEILAHYEEILDIESLIRQGYFSEFLNNFIEYRNFGAQGGLMLTGIMHDNIRAYKTVHEFDRTKISGGIFNLDNFNQWLHRAKVNYFYKNDSIDALNEWTTPVHYSAPSDSGSRINYKLPNLFSYANTSLYIDKNRDKMIDYFINNRNSVSKFFKNDVYDDCIKDEIKADLLIGKSKRYTVKIQDFPRSLYTHSIEWIMGGKLEAKRSLNKKSSNGDAKPGYVSDLNFGNKLDLLMRVSQNGETHGIPVGTLASRIVAEIYMCKFDEELLSEKKLSFSREFDKLTFGYDTDYELMEIKRLVHDLSNKYSLSLSEVSSECNSFPFIESSYKNILNYFDLSPLCYEVDIQSKNIKNVELSIRRQIYQFIDYCVSEEGRGVEGSLEAMIPALVSSVRDGSINSLMDRVFETSEEKVESLQRILIEPNYFTDLSIFEKILDVCVLYPRITQKYIDFSQFMVNLAADSSGKESELEKLIGANVAKYFSKAVENLADRVGYILEQGYSQELHSLLTLFIVFDYDKNYMSEIEVKEMCRAIISSGIDDINMILATMICYRKFENFDDILEDAAKILWRSHYIVCEQSDDEYIEDKNWYKKLCSCGREFSGEFWMYRYFMYSLNNEQMFSDGIFPKDMINNKAEYKINFMNEDKYESLPLPCKEESGEEVGVYPSFRESLNRVEIKSSMSLSDHFKFRLTEKEVESRLQSKNERRGMLVHKFYREMLDSGVRITGKGNKNLNSRTYGFMYGLSK